MNTPTLHTHTQVITALYIAHAFSSVSKDDNEMGYLKIYYLLN